MLPKPIALMLLLLGTPLWLSTPPTAAAGRTPLETTAASDPRPPSPADETIRDATLVFRHLVDTPSPAIPASIMMRARAIAVFPGASSDGGVYFGAGVMSVRDAFGSGWTVPAMLFFRGGIPARLEASSVDFVIVSLTRRGLNYLTQEEFLPLETRIHPGPLGHDAPEDLSADLVGYMRFGDYFAGVSIEDVLIVGTPSANQDLYGRPYSTSDIVIGAGFFNPPAAARDWRNTLAAYFRKMS
jgi:lipid-binding SYLF domain-containing protein